MRKSDLVYSFELNLASESSGVGKTYTSIILKKVIDKKYNNTSCKLYDDFDPSAVGVSIQNLALQYATSKTPVIIVIDEIDTIFEDVFEKKDNYDSRIRHTKNRKTFHTMLDNLGSYKNVIIIFTSEYSPNSLIDENEKYKSFLRKGRVDMVLKMDKEDCVVDDDHWKVL